MIQNDQEVLNILIKGLEKSLYPSDVADKIIDLVIQNGKNSKNEVINILVEYLTESTKKKEAMFSELKKLTEARRQG